jgi:hypothetical protein
VAAIRSAHILMSMRPMRMVNAATPLRGNREASSASSSWNGSVDAIQKMPAMLPP